MCCPRSRVQAPVGLDQCPCKDDHSDEHDAEDDKPGGVNSAGKGFFLPFPLLLALDSLFTFFLMMLMVLLVVVHDLLEGTLVSSS